MTTIRPARKAAAQPDGFASGTGHLEDQHLPSGRLRGRRLSRWPLAWMVPAAAALAAVLVFGMEAGTVETREARPAMAEASASAPAVTGSFSTGLPSPPDAPSVTGSVPRPSSPGVIAARPAPDGSGARSPVNAPAAETRREPARPPALTLSSEEITAHLARGEEKLKAGELAAARLYFERVASSGDARGALGMARSFDPAVLATLPVIGPHGDAAAARLWYERASSLQARR